MPTEADAIQTETQTEGTGNTPGESGTPPAETVTLTRAQIQEQIDAAVKDRLKREQEKNDKATQKAADEARAKALKEQQDWKSLAEQHESRVKELEPVAQRVEELEKVVVGLLETTLNGLDASARTAVDDLPTSDPVLKLNWLNKHGARFAKRSPHDINGTDRSGEGTVTVSDVKNQKLSSGRYQGL